MRILAIESSGMVASAAVTEEDRVLAEYSVNNKKTHSQTLLPMIDELMKILEAGKESIDAVAVSKGPGSFTGLRIGSATAKGIAMALNVPMIEISSLEAMAYRICGTEKIICPLMDARRGQVYTALFECAGENGEVILKRITEDEPMDITELVERINQTGRSVIFLGDGVPVHEERIGELIRVGYAFAPAHVNRQSASSLGILAFEYVKKGMTIDPDMHRPEYLRLSQAERERMERNG